MGYRLGCSRYETKPSSFIPDLYPHSVCSPPLLLLPYTQSDLSVHCTCEHSSCVFRMLLAARDDHSCSTSAATGSHRYILRTRYVVMDAKLGGASKPLLMSKTLQPIFCKRPLRNKAPTKRPSVTHPITCHSTGCV